MQKKKEAYMVVYPDPYEPYYFTFPTLELAKKNLLSHEDAKYLCKILFIKATMIKEYPI